MQEVFSFGGVGEVDGWAGVGFSLLFSICPPAVAE